MSYPKATVICISHNAGRFYGEAIQSVLAQDFTDFELLLVDDGSTDGTAAQAMGYAVRHPDRILYLEHPGHAHEGAGATRNLGLAYALGDYVAFIEAHDRWRPHKLREQVAIMEANREIGMVAGVVNQWRSWEGGNDRLVPTGHLLDAVAPAPEAALAVYPLGKCAPPCPSDIMLRRSVLEKVGCFEPNVTGPFEDSACFGKVLLAAPVYLSSCVWVDHRRFDSSEGSEPRYDERYPAKRSAFFRWYADYLKLCDAPRRKAVLSAVRRTRWRDFLHGALHLRS